MNGNPKDPRSYSRSRDGSQAWSLSGGHLQFTREDQVTLVHLQECHALWEGVSGPLKQQDTPPRRGLQLRRCSRSLTPKSLWCHERKPSPCACGYNSPPDTHQGQPFVRNWLQQGETAARGAGERAPRAPASSSSKPRSQPVETFEHNLRTPAFLPLS